MKLLAAAAAAVALTATPLRAATGGPDAGGYMWDNSFSYSWIDVSGTGTQLGGGGSDDINWAALPLGFTFNFYGQNYTNVNLCSNGWLSFTDSTSTAVGSTVLIPDPAAPNGMVALLKEDLNPNGTGTPPGYIFYETVTVGGLTVFVAQWRNVVHSGANSRYNVEVLLRSDNSIVMQYQSVSSWWAAWTHAIGIENQGGTVGLEYVQDPADNLAVRYYPGNPTATPTPAPPTYSPPYFDDFEGGKPATDWSTGQIGSTLSSWLRGMPVPGNSTPVAPAPYSGSTCWGTNANNGEFYANENSFLVSPIFALPSGTLVVYSMRHWFSYENGDDGGRVEVTTNGGSSWTPLVPSGGYPGNTNGNHPAFPNQPAYTGLNGGASWNLSTVDLSTYAGQQVRLRMHHGSDFNTSTAGWYVDDVAVNTLGTPTPSATPTYTYDTYTYTPSGSPTHTRTVTPTASAVASQTHTRTISWTPSASMTATATLAAGGEIGIWPNPYSPPRDGVARFANLPTGSRLVIYTFHGVQVRRFEFRANVAEPTWNGLNDAKERVQTGPYFWIATLPGGRKVNGTIYVSDTR